MLISRNWLQSHFETELPNAESIAHTLMLHSFEIEEVTSLDDDQLIDIDVLPNRAHDCLSYSGIAREYAALTGMQIKQNRYHFHQSYQKTDLVQKVKVHNTKQCYRYMTRVIGNIHVQASPKWLQDRLSVIGQRSVNNIVDITNYVMFDLGNPMHAFDADKIVGDLVVRNAFSGETMTTLSGENLELLEGDLVIADEEGVLALAGVKGGVRAEVNEQTKNIVIEVANFNPTTTRTTARRVKILTDASKRFENALSSEIADSAMEAATRLIADSAHTESLVVGPIVDIYSNKEEQVIVRMDHQQVKNLLGCDIGVEEVNDIFDRLDYQYHLQESTYFVHIPFERLDIRIPEDLIEEIGRIYGYHNIPVQDLSDYNFEPRVNSGIFLQQKIRNILVQHGFSDVMTYSFLKKGDVEVFNPIASDKKALRKNLHKQLNDVLEKNLRNVDYFGFDQVKIFEIGRVYTKRGEQTLCSIAIANYGKSARKKYGNELEQLNQVLKMLESELGISLDFEIEDKVLSFRIDNLDYTADSYASVFDIQSYDDETVFHEISVFPFMRRDISLWADTEIENDQLISEITKTDTCFLKKVFLFDTFEKDGRKSYAYSLIFQSHEKTLTDTEVDFDMQHIIARLEQLGSEIR